MAAVVVMVLVSAFSIWSSTAPTSSSPNPSPQTAPPRSVYEIKSLIKLASEERKMEKIISVNSFELHLKMLMMDDNVDLCWHGTIMRWFDMDDLKSQWID